MQKRHVDVVVISDLHLGIYGCHAKEIVNYLQSISPNLLILNGDIVDGWQFNKRYFPAAHLEVINEIFNLQHNGTRVVYITGNNYDYVICGHIHQPQQKVITNKHGKVIYLNSGDWIENLTSLEYYDHGWHIYHYCDEEFKETALVKKIQKPETTVIKREVDLFL